LRGAKSFGKFDLSLDSEPRLKSRSFRATGKSEILYFDEFAIHLNLMQQSIFRSGVENHVANAFFRGGLATLLPEDVQEEFVSVTSENRSRGY
jgi:hypothetical protein